MSEYLLPEALVNKAREVVEANGRGPPARRCRKLHRRSRQRCTDRNSLDSSDVFEAGYVTYSNAAKISELKVSEEVVDTFGSVSVARRQWLAERSPPRTPMSQLQLRELPGPAAERPRSLSGPCFRTRRRVCRPGKDRGRPKILRREQPVGSSPSGGALRA